jgi:regulator-associated protein of mTOR
MRERLKTVSVAVVMCLNIGVDPPDVVKTNPAAKLEAWTDPFSMPPQKALETIGRNLQTQYEVWQPRARYKLSLDPSVEETKKLCVGLRRNAKEERILFHYNGHGVPKPTPGGEIWVFNKNYTQYIPVSIYDIQTWLSSPCIFVYDCSHAGNILLAFNRFAEQRDAESQKQKVNPPSSATNVGTPSITPGQSPSTPTQPFLPFSESIQLAACGPNQVLPMNPDLPADMFTCCLTTPIEIALRWFVMQNPLLANITPDMIMKIPGRLNDRRTPLGELNWIFTAITDTIAWNVLPHDLFKKLFRQDLMVAALFRNFLLAERIMRSYNCTPMSYPALPATHQHPLWQAWDLAADMVLTQLPALLAAEAQLPTDTNVLNTPPVPMSPVSGTPTGPTPGDALTKVLDYKHSTFFAEQLTAFEVWLSKGTISKKPPEQLPIVLQVLLSQVHRLRALMLLSRFLDLGPWAVNLALSVGIFPYVLKLLQSPAAELKPVLVFIWAKILAVDLTCQNDLLKDNGFLYFIHILAAPPNQSPIVPNLSEHRAMCCFILSVFCHEFRPGQQACLKAMLLTACGLHLQDPDPLLRQWACICIGKLWEKFSDAKFVGIKEGMHDKLCDMLTDYVPEVRAAAVFALGAFLGDMDRNEQIVNIELNVAISTLVATSDASSLVRRELIVALSKIVVLYQSRFASSAMELMDDDVKRVTRTMDDVADSVGSVGSAGMIMPKRADSMISTASSAGSFTVMKPQERSGGSTSVFSCLWKVLLNLSVDPHPEVAWEASSVVDYVMMELITSKQINPMNLKAVTDASLGSPRTTSPAKDEIRRAGSNASFLKRIIGQPEPKRDSLQSTANLIRSPSALSAMKGVPTTPGVAGYHPARLGRDQSGQSLHMEELESIRSESKTPVLTTPSGTMVPATNHMPLNSTFFEWCCEYFAEPQMKLPEVEDPGSEEYNERQWKHQRNEKLLYEARLVQPIAGRHRMDEKLGTLHSEGENLQMLLFHQYEPHLITVNDSDLVSVWNWTEGVRVNVFCNSNPKQSRATSLKIINEEEGGLLAVGSSEGVVRIYRHYDEPDKIEVVSAWKALPDMFPPQVGSKGSVMDWQQSTGSLVVSGDVRFLRVWDVEKELCLQDIPTRSMSSVTCLTSDRVGALLIAGFADGTIRIYDRRLNPKDGMVGHLQDPNTSIVDAFLQRAQMQELITGSTNGELKLWDLRYPNPTKSLAIFQQSEMRCMAVHDNAPLIAWYVYLQY